MLTTGPQNQWTEWNKTQHFSIYEEKSHVRNTQIRPYFSDVLEYKTMKLRVTTVWSLWTVMDALPHPKWSYRTLRFNSDASIVDNHALIPAWTFLQLWATSSYKHNRKKFVTNNYLSITVRTKFIFGEIWNLIHLYPHN